MTVPCPSPWPDFRPGACNCDGIYDAADARGEDAAKAREDFIAKLRGLVITECAACDGAGYTETWQS